MKKSIILALLILIPGVASAHQLATDKNIGVVLHVDPNDNPIATQSSGFYFDFSDRDNKFQLASCLCSVSIKQNGQELTTEQLSSTNLSTASFQYVFPTPGVYQVQVVGVPQSAHSFQPFSVSYDVRVTDATSGTAAQVPDWAWALIVLAGACLVALAIARAPRRKPMPKK